MEYFKTILIIFQKQILPFPVSRYDQIQRGNEGMLENERFGTSWESKRVEWGGGGGLDNFAAG